MSRTPGYTQHLQAAAKHASGVAFEHGRGIALTAAKYAARLGFGAPVRTEINGAKVKLTYRDGSVILGLASGEVVIYPK